MWNSEPETNMIPYSTASRMASVYKDCTTKIHEAFETINKQIELLDLTFIDAQTTGSDFGFSMEYHGTRFNRGELDQLFTAYSRTAWALLADRIGIKKIMSMKARDQFNDQLKRGDLPEISEETIIAVLKGFCAQATELAQDAIKEVFDWLRPMRSEYKSNNVFKIGRRVVKEYCVEQGWHNRYRVGYDREKYLIALDSAFNTLAGRGPLTGTKGPLVDAINATAIADGVGETDLFRFRCFKNKNIHIYFKRLDLVKELNRVATGIAELGEDQ